MVATPFAISKFTVFSKTFHGHNLYFQELIHVRRKQCKY